MHAQAIPEMKKNLYAFIPELFSNSSSVLDVGSLEIKKKGNYRSIFNESVTYIGCDLIPGPNVDVVLESEDVLPWEDNTFDCVISGQVIEHCSNPFTFVKECARVLRPKGVLFIVGPSAGSAHGNKKLGLFDRWRIQVDGMITLLESANLNILKTYIDEGSEYWLDCWGIGKK